MRGFFEHPSSSPRERLALRLVGTKGRRSLLRCRHFKFYIESDDCLLDPRLIDPSFSANAPRCHRRGRWRGPLGIEVCHVQTG